MNFLAPSPLRPSFFSLSFSFSGDICMEVEGGGWQYVCDESTVPGVRLS